MDQNTYGDADIRPALQTSAWFLEHQVPLLVFKNGTEICPEPDEISSQA